jgi:hypothetical protein
MRARAAEAEGQMTDQKSEQVQYRDDDGDELLSPFELRLWAICLSARQAFNADVIFTRSMYEGDTCIQFFIERDHPRLDQLKTYLSMKLAAFSEELAEEDWHIRVELIPYSGVPGALAFMQAIQQALVAGVEFHHPDRNRLSDLAVEVGREVARLSKNRP